MAESTSNGAGVLSPGAIALDELEQLGLRHLVTDDPPDIDPRGWFTAWENTNYEAPEERTLPVLGRDGLILEGGTNLLYSYPKVGKTELLTQMAGEWCDMGLQVRYLTEESRGNWRKRLTVHHVTSTNLHFYHAWGCDLSHVLCLLDTEAYDVLIVDTLRNAIGFIESDGDKDVARVIHPLLQATAGRTVVVGYHARKMPGDGGRDISGHHALYGAFDRALQMTPVEGRENQRKIQASGRCMYDGDMQMFYEQTAPGMLRALDGMTMVDKAKERTSYELQCRDCGDWFEAHRRDAMFCSAACRQRARRETTVSDTEAVTDIQIPRGIRDICDRNVDAECSNRLTDWEDVNVRGDTL